MSQLYEILTMVKEEITAEGMTAPEVDRVLRGVINRYHQRKVEALQNKLGHERENFLAFGTPYYPVRDVPFENVKVDTSRNARLPNGSNQGIIATNNTD